MFYSSSLYVGFALSRYSHVFLLPRNSVVTGTLISGPLHFSLSARHVPGFAFIFRNVIAWCLRRKLFLRQSLLNSSRSCSSRIRVAMFPFFSFRASMLNPTVRILQVNASLSNLYRHLLQSPITVLPSKCLSRNSYYSFHGCPALYLLLQSVFILRRFGPASSFESL